jgi:hypothetical protein
MTTEKYVKDGATIPDETLEDVLYVDMGRRALLLRIFTEMAAFIVGLEMHRSQNLKQIVFCWIAYFAGARP